MVKSLHIAVRPLAKAVTSMPNPGSIRTLLSWTLRACTLRVSRNLTYSGPTPNDSESSKLPAWQLSAETLTKPQVCLEVSSRHFFPMVKETIRVLRILHTLSRSSSTQFTDLQALASTTPSVTTVIKITL